MRWEVDKAWSDRFVPEIKRILGEHLIGVAEVADDAFRNTDLITLRLPSDVRIACRIRKHEYLQPYGGEFTLRCSRPSGAATEIDKVLDGWGDYFFYGFSDGHERRLASWFLGRLDVFRKWIDWYWAKYHDWPGELRENVDGSSRFMAFALDELPPEFIVARRATHETTATMLN